MEKEFAQAAGRSDTAGKTDQQTFQSVLSQPQNRYLVRQLCWVLTVQGLETYLLVPRDPTQIDLLVDAIRPASSPMDIDVVIGLRGPVASPEMCNGLMIPMGRGRSDLFLQPRRAHQGHPEAAEDDGGAVQRGLRGAVRQDHAADRQCGGDGRPPRLELPFHAVSGDLRQGAEEFANDFSLTGVDVRPSPLSSTRNMVDVIFSYTNRNTDFTEKFSCAWM